MWVLHQLGQLRDWGNIQAIIPPLFVIHLIAGREFVVPAADQRYDLDMCKMIFVMWQLKLARKEVLILSSPNCVDRKFEILCFQNRTLCCKLRYW
jgi:hypothetical protein